MLIDRLRYELQLMGKRAILPPLVTMGGYILFTFLLFYLRTAPGRFLESGPEMILPMVVGMFAGTLISADPALELQLTMPRRYQKTAILRVFVILLWTAGIALLFINLAAACNLEYMLQPPQPQPGLVRFLTRELVWLGPLFWCVGIASCSGLLMKSRTAGAALLGGIWIIEIIFKDTLAYIPWLRPVLLFPTTLVTPPTVVSQDIYTLWLTSRFEVLGTGLLFVVLAWLLLRNPESLLRTVNEE